MNRAKKTILTAAILVLFIGQTSALDINSSQPLNYYNSGVLDFQVDTTGQINAQNNLNMNGNSITSFFGSACPTGEVVYDVKNGGSFGCVNVTSEVQDTYVNRGGDTMTGSLNLQNNNLYLGSDVYLSENSNNDMILQGRDPEQKLELTDGGSLIYREYTSSSNNVFEVSSTGSGNAAVRLGEAGSSVNLDMNGNSITNFFGSACSTGNVTVHVNDDGSFDCVDVSSEVQGDFVARSGDTMTGTLDMQGNTIINAGSGNIDIGDGSGDINMNGNRIYGSSIGHFQEGGISGTLSNTQNNLDTLSANSFYVAGDVKVGGDFIGTGGDVAEIVNTEDDSNLEPGTVTTISGDIEVSASTEAYDTAVAGIVSTDPGVKLAQYRDGVPLALTGIVPVKATVENGEIQHGDLLTTSEKEGYAMKCSDASRCQGAIIGKAMGSLEENGKVETLVTLG